MTEFEIQNILYRWFIKKTSMIIPNIYLYTWESDLLAVTRSNFVHEFEIKRSTPDFNSDFNKTLKHEVLEYGKRKSKYHSEESWFQKTNPGYVCANDGFIHEQHPNYFWYVCEQNLVNILDVPKYAGLIYVNKNSQYVNKIKNAPRLHNNKLSDFNINKIAISLQYRYWKLRLNK